jgi:hypothetical protein
VKGGGDDGVVSASREVALREVGKNLGSLTTDARVLRRGGGGLLILYPWYYSYRLT